MPFFQNPGAIFGFGTMVPSEQKFLKLLLMSAVQNGYTRFVEPCAGAFAMSHLAVQSGFSPSHIEASDVSMMTSIMGCSIQGKDTGELEIRADGFSDEELKDPATALYAQLYLRTVKNAGKEYFYNLLLDLQYRREKHIEDIQGQLNRAREVLHGMSYRPLDMWEHLDEVLDDPHAVVVANPPTYLSGYEKFYDTQGRMTWKEPEYELFDPKTDYQRLMEKCRGANAMVLCYQESETGKTAGTPVFARQGVRAGVNTYIITNKPEEATALAKGRKIARPSESRLQPLDCSMMPRDYVITPKSKIQLCGIQRAEAQYYRELWTHNFHGAGANTNMALLIDGKMAGVFGINKSTLTMGAYGARVSDCVFLMYGMTVPHKTYRLGRLLTMLAQNRGFIFSICNDLEKEKARRLKTVQMTKYPEVKEMRGIMKLTNRTPDERMGYRLVYESELKDRTEKQTLEEWLRREDKWRRERAKVKSDTNS